jgi:putative ABC transport system permease protein
MMAKQPGLTAILALTLALGIGASTTIFSVVSSVVLKPLPYHEPDRLVRVFVEAPAEGLDRFPLSVPELYDLRAECQTCMRVSGFARGTASLSGGERPVRIDAMFSNHELLPMLGVQPHLGRFFDASEDRPGDYSVILLGYNVWQRAFGGDPEVIGRTIQMDAMPVKVIGVMPAGFDFLDRAEAWMPANLDVAKENRNSHNWHAIVRLKDGVSFEAFQDELVALRGRWSQRKTMAEGVKGMHVHTINDEHRMIGVPFHTDLVGSLARTLWLLQAAVLLVLLIAMVNIANLLLARAETRRREVAVRHALGASQRRLLRQFVTESWVLGILGGGLGILVAAWAVDGVTALIPSSAPRVDEIAVDGRAVAFALAATGFATLVFGVVPILYTRKTDLHGALKATSRTTASRTSLRARRALVIAEIAFAVVLVIGCVVMVRSFARLQRVELGYLPERALVFNIEAPVKTYPGTTVEVYWHRLEDKLRALPGVERVSLLSGLPPFRYNNQNGFHIPGRTENLAVPWIVDYWQLAGSDLPAALGARVVKGRSIDARDTAATPGVVMVNEAFVAKFLPGVDPIGLRVQMASDKYDQTIVGVVADYKQGGVDQPSGTEVFVPVYQLSAIRPGQAPASLNVIVRTTGDAEPLFPEVQRVVKELDPTIPVYKLRTLDDVHWESIARPRFLTLLLVCFAIVALVLAAVGIYGVMAHTVVQRTSEIGLRVALGAQPKQVRALVLRQAAFLVAFGVGVGLAVTIGLELALGDALERLFYGERLAQPLLIVVVAIVVAGAALLATWIPVRRATQVQPTEAMRID